MRGSAIIIILALLTAVACMPAAEAEAPAHVYFFKDGTCISEAILIPGEPIKASDIPSPGDHMSWYDEDGERIYAGRTFSSGEHTAKPYDMDHPPGKQGGEDRHANLAVPIAAGVLALAGLGAVMYVYRRR